ncbi:hypothetical protein MUO65_05270, partial [bacterium]|nr:hypothetical protein [bacterium]
MTKRTLHYKASLLGELAGFDVTGLPLAIFPKKHIARSSLIYPAAGEKGECVNLFKVLQSNLCENNCFYCINRRDRDCPRVEFTPQELASLFLEYCKKGWVKGLFLSSAINISPDASQDSSTVGSTFTRFSRPEAAFNFQQVLFRGMREVRAIKLS